MTWEILFVLCVLAATFASFLWEKISTDLTAIIAFSVLLLASSLSGSEHLPTLEEYLKVFANPAPITIACMFIVSTALQKTGAIDRLAALFSKLTFLGYRRFIFVMSLIIGTISAFMNNTPVVVLLMPVIMTLSKEMKISASKLLIPLSYASILGGTCTLIGTSTNILATGIIEAEGYRPLGMFELGKVGIFLFGIGATYIALAGWRLLPVRETLTSILSDDERKEFITEAFIKPNTELDGALYPESVLAKTQGVRVLDVIRDGVPLGRKIDDVRFESGDRLVLACRPSGVVEAHQLEGIDLIAASGLDLEKIAASEGSIIEAVISPNSSIIGRTIRQTNFRQRFRMVILAVHRGGKNLREKIDSLTLQAGDTLLMLGTEKAIENLRKDEDILLLDRPHIPAQDSKGKMPIVIATIIGIILSASLDILPIYVATIIGVVVVFLSGAIKPKDGYASVQWGLLILIYGMLSVGLAMEKSGATRIIIDNLLSSIDSFAPAGSKPYIMLAIIYLVTWVLTELLSNQATVALMLPLCLGVATSLGIDTRPFIITVCVAASSSFTTPIGFQTNTYVYSVGGYRFTDFVRFGLPLNIIFWIATSLLVPQIFPF